MTRDVCECGARAGIISLHGRTRLQFCWAHLGMADSLILMVMALVVFGPRRLPQIGRQIGKLMYEFRKASNDFKFQMEEELRNSEEADRRKKEEERQRSLAALAATEQASVSADPRGKGQSSRPIPAKALSRPQYPPETPAATTPRNPFHASCRPPPARQSQPRGPGAR